MLSPIRKGLIQRHLSAAGGDLRRDDGGTVFDVHQFHPSTQGGHHLCRYLAGGLRPVQVDLGQDRRVQRVEEPVVAGPPVDIGPFEGVVVIAHPQAVAGGQGSDLVEPVGVPADAVGGGEGISGEAQQTLRDSGHRPGAPTSAISWNNQSLHAGTGRNV